jgi:hypothetical protein
MIEIPKLLEYKTLAESAFPGFTKLEFNHYGIQAKDANAYLKEINSIGPALSEVVFSGRRISTVMSTVGVLEILEPKTDQVVTETAIDHIAYICPDIEELKKTYTSEIISSFDVGGTHGFKISPAKGIVIELRNNSILDSVDDFTSHSV